jgi:hypothetical protein
MKAKNVAMLVCKDLRMGRRAFLTGLALWMAPMAIMIVVSLCTGTQVFHVDNVVVCLGMFGSGLFILIIPMVVSQILAGEEAEGSAAFLAQLPFTRGEAWAGKAASTILVTGAFLALALAAFAVDMMDGWSSFRNSLDAYTTWVLPGAAMLLGSVWLAGAVLKRTAMATILGMLVPVLLWSSVFVYASIRYFSVPSHYIWQELRLYYAILSILLGMMFFAAGTVVFMNARR